MTKIERVWETLKQLDDPRQYYFNGILHGVMASKVVGGMRTLYSAAVNDKFTVGMLRDIIGYRAQGDLCLVTDDPKAFDRLSQLLEERYNFTCIVSKDVIKNKEIMFSFYFKER